MLYTYDGNNANMFLNSGKKFATIGDSIANRGWWQEYVCALTNMTYTNYSAGGTAITKINTSDSDYFGARVPNMANDFDVIIVWGGVNDFLLNAELGEMGDTTNGTFYGAVNNLCEALISKYKEAKIGFCTTTPIASLATQQAQNLPFGGGDQPNTKGYYLSQYMDAIKEVCAEHSIPVLDLYKESGFNQQNIDVMTSYKNETGPDGLHPSHKGFKLIANKSAMFIGNL